MTSDEVGGFLLGLMILNISRFGTDCRLSVGECVVCVVFGCGGRFVILCDLVFFVVGLRTCGRCGGWEVFGEVR